MITFPRDVIDQFTPQKITERSRNLVGMTTAPYTGWQQIQEFAGAWWEMEITFPPLGQRDGQRLVAFLESLRGQVGTFLFGNPKKATPRGSAATVPGNPLVDGFANAGLRLNVRTSLADQQAWLKAGDQISLGAGVARHLHRVVTDADLISGRVTLNVWPRLREVPTDGDPITLYQPTGLFRLAVAAPQHDVDESGIYYVDPIPIIEALGN